jgi:hypothetical protein
MQALLERKMPDYYKTLHTVKSLALSMLVKVCAAGLHRDQPEPHGTRARRRGVPPPAKYFSMVGELKYLPCAIRT